MSLNAGMRVLPMTSSTCFQSLKSLTNALHLLRFTPAGLQVISMASDSVIKLWDLRNNRCMQTIAEKAWPHPSHAHPTAMLFEPRRRRVVTIEHQPMYWKHMCCADDQQGHSQPLVAVLYSPEFHLVRPCHKATKPCQSTDKERAEVLANFQSAIRLSCLSSQPS